MSMHVWAGSISQPQGITPEHVISMIKGKTVGFALDKAA